MSLVALSPMISRPKAAVLAWLMLASALTEGLGLVLLVPLLTVLSRDQPGRLDRWLGALGIPVTLEALLGLFVVLVALRSAINQARLVMAERFQLGLIDQLRNRAWHALLHCDWRVLQSLRRSDSASLLLGEVERVGYGVQQAISAIGIVLTLAAILLAALTISPLVTISAGLSGVVVLAAYAGLRRRANVLGENLGRAFSDSYAAFSEGLSAMRVIKSLAGEDRAEAETQATVAAMRQAQIGYVRDRAMGQAALQLGGAAALALLVWLAVQHWGMGASAILPMVALFARALPLLGNLQESWLQWRHSRPALDATLALITRAEAAREPDSIDPSAPLFSHELRLRDVTVQFEEAEQPALNTISLTIPAGSIVAISGASGAGKSTLADLLGGLISPDSGIMTVDGQIIDPARRRAWRRRVGYVQQDPVMLAASVRENLIWGQDYSDSAIESALAAASAEFALALPQGLGTRLGDGGRMLSGGERQRLMLARALLRRPALLILDEATSALDAENEALIAAALQGLKGQMAILLIAHRGALGDLADLTYRLERGQLKR
ncbi:MAG: ABC transporter ATP-binding protein [Novosphingobium sp.]|uniref:ATP-binding cassette domain-containing protein n=1 Tax=Novosphingobium sp. TaxID=1874826 RepID=UPI0032BACDAC